MLSKIDEATRQYRESVIHQNGTKIISKEATDQLLEILSPENIVSDFTIFCQLPPYLLRTAIFPKHTIIDIGLIPFFEDWAMFTIDYFGHPSHNRVRKASDAPPSIYFFKDLDNYRIFKSLLKVGNDNSLRSLFAPFSPLDTVVNYSANKILACFVFPFLEGLVREECNGFLTIDGNIIDVEKLPLVLKSKYNNRKPVMSSLCDELLLFTLAGSNPFRNTVNDLIVEFATCVQATKPPYANFADARNGTLHGDITYKGAMVAKLIVFLLFLSRIHPEEYNINLEKLKQERGWTF
jgi:hypothetical protein